MRRASVYYWDAVPNFGDRIAVDLLKHFVNVDAGWAGWDYADIVVTGSIIEQVPAGWDGLVAGAGVLCGDSSPDLSSAKVLAVRGPLSLARITCADKNLVTLGDPGLLADELVTVPTRDRALGILPHWTDTRLANVGVFQQYDPLFISPFDDPATVAKQVGRCRKLVTSSLHGVILADSFGIPREV